MKKLLLITLFALGAGQANVASATNLQQCLQNLTQYQEQADIDQATIQQLQAQLYAKSR